MPENKPSESRDSRSMKQQDDIHNLKLAQAKGDIPMVDANRKINLERPTKVNILQVREVEASRYVHVFCRNLHDDPNSKQYNVEDKVVQIHVGEFDMKVRQKYFQAFDLVEIIHDPRTNAEPIDLQPGKKKVEVPAQRQAQPNNAQASELRAKAQELSAKEKELIAKQTELEAKESELKAKEEAFKTPTPTKK